MTSEMFVYWLQGALEIMDPKTLDEKQIQVIKDHIALVLTKVTPDHSLIGNPNTFRIHPDIYNPPMPVYPWSPTAPTVICGSGTAGKGIWSGDLPVDNTTAAGTSGTLVDTTGSTLATLTDEQKDKIRQAVDKLSDKQRIPRRPRVFC